MPTQWNPVMIDEDTLRDMLRDIEDIKRRLELLRSAIWQLGHGGVGHEAR